MSFSFNKARLCEIMQLARKLYHYKRLRFNCQKNSKFHYKVQELAFLRVLLNGFNKRFIFTDCRVNYKSRFYRKSICHTKETMKWCKSICQYYVYFCIPRVPQKTISWFDLYDFVPRDK